MNKKLSEICDILNGYAFESSKYVSDGIRVIRITNVQKGYVADDDPKFYPQEYAEEISKYMLKSDDLLMSLTGNVGRVALLTDEFLPAALNQRVACLRLKSDDVLKTYLFHILNSDYFENKCIFSAKGVAQKNLSTEWLKDYEIPLPPLEIQREIAYNLDKVSETINLCREILDKLDYLVKAKFAEMFGDIIHNDKNWPYVALSDVAEIKIGPFGSLLHKEDYVKNGHAIVNPSHIIDGKIVIDEDLTISDEKFEELRAYELKLADVVLGRRGEMGRCAIVEEKGMLCGTGSMIIRPNGKVIPYFLQAILSSKEYKRILENSAVGVTMPNLNVPIVSSIVIPLFPIDLQRSYTAFLMYNGLAKSVVKKTLDKAKTLKNALMQKYFG